MTHGDAREGKWKGNWRMEWVASTLHTTSEHGVSSITTADAHTSAASSRLNWRPPADLNGLVRFAERRNLVSARVPSRFKSSLHPANYSEQVPYWESDSRWAFRWILSVQELATCFSFKCVVHCVSDIIDIISWLQIQLCYQRHTNNCASILKGRKHRQYCVSCS